MITARYTACSTAPGPRRNADTGRLGGAAARFTPWLDAVQRGALRSPPALRDVLDGTSPDANGNGVPDECEACPGDLDCSGAVDFVDINAFVLYLSSFPVWQTTYAGCLAANGDIDSNGEYPSFGDINPFVTLLTTHSLPLSCGKPGRATTANATMGRDKAQIEVTPTPNAGGR